MNSFSMHFRQWPNPLKISAIFQHCCAMWLANIVTCHFITDSLSETLYLLNNHIPKGPKWKGSNFCAVSLMVSCLLFSRGLLKGWVWGHSFHFKGASWFGTTFLTRKRNQTVSFQFTQIPACFVWQQLLTAWHTLFHNSSRNPLLWPPRIWTPDEETFRPPGKRCLIASKQFLSNTKVFCVYFYTFFICLFKLNVCSFIPCRSGITHSTMNFELHQRSIQSFWQKLLWIQKQTGKRWHK